MITVKVRFLVDTIRRLTRVRRKGVPFIHIYYRMKRGEGREGGRDGGRERRRVCIKRKGREGGKEGGRRVCIRRRGKEGGSEGGEEDMHGCMSRNDVVNTTEEESSRNPKIRKRERRVRASTKMWHTGGTLLLVLLLLLGRL